MPYGFKRRNSGSLLLLLAQVDEDLLVLEVLLGQDHPHLLAERAVGIVVELQHRARLLRTPPPHA